MTKKAHKLQTGSVWGSDIWAVETEAGLLFQATNAGRADLARAMASRGYNGAECEVIDAIGGNGLDFIPPAYLGLTEMPAFSEGLAYSEEGDSRFWDESGAPIYGFPDYMIKCPWRALRDTGRVLFPIVERS